MKNNRSDKIIEQAQKSVPLPDNYDDIDLNEILGGKEYTPAINQNLQNSFVDMNNIDKYRAKQPENPQNIIKQSLNTITKAPDFNNAGSKLNQMNEILSKLGGLATVNNDNIPNQGRPSQAPTSTLKQSVQNQQRPPIDISIIYMKKTLEALRDVNSWIPESKKEYTQKLSATAMPIIKALDAYVTLIEKMK